MNYFKSCFIVADHTCKLNKLFLWLSYKLMSYYYCSFSLIFFFFYFFFHFVDIHKLMT